MLDCSPLASSVDWFCLSAPHVWCVWIKETWQRPPVKSRSFLPKSPQVNTDVGNETFNGLDRKLQNFCEIYLETCLPRRSRRSHNNTCFKQQSGVDANRKSGVHGDSQAVFRIFSLHDKTFPLVPNSYRPISVVRLVVC